jgi:NDP-sugar pyrophosphorylase family protein
MQIVIPMSGFGERFRRAGYSVPKPLIEVEGKPIIAHVLSMFPNETDIFFICNQEHLDNPAYRMAEIIQQYCPTGKIVGISPHKLGPVNAVMQVIHLLDMQRPVVVNYCDFTCYWDWHHFKAFVETTKCAGSIPAYKGVHPHSLGTTNYAYMRESNKWVHDIQEKQPYTDNRMQEYASSGTYYFVTAQLMTDAFQYAMTNNLSIGGEYYVSLTYKSILAQGLPVTVYDLQHFMQWGTPEDLAEYNYWSNAFRRLNHSHTPQMPANGSLIVPMAGLGQRFVNEGYNQPKPLIPVSGKAMVTQAITDLPCAQHHSFVIRTTMVGHDHISAELAQQFTNTVITNVDYVTEGQAITAEIGLHSLLKHTDSPGVLTFAACDNGVLYDEATFTQLIADEKIDIIVWAVRGYPNAARNPHMFGWIDVDNEGCIHAISVKQPLANPTYDPIVLGTFTFRNATIFQAATDRMRQRNGHVNGEYYIDSCINDAIELGMNCRLFEIDSYLCWGTPDDLRTFEYWQSCFHKWDDHPYRLQHDARVAPSAIAELERRYAKTVPDMPVGDHV